MMMLEEANVAVSPGSGFGAAGEGYLPHGPRRKRKPAEAGGKADGACAGVEAMKSNSPSRGTSERMNRAVERVRERLLHSTAALNVAGIPYAVAGGNAVAAWVESADTGGVRTCPDDDIIVQKNDFEAARDALAAIGFVYARTNGIHAFLESSDSKIRDAVRMFITGERVRADDFWPVPDIADASFAPSAKFWHLSLESLVGMCLSSFCLVENVYLRDLANVELIDCTWLNRFPPELASRLQHILDTPDHYCPAISRTGFSG